MADLEMAVLVAAVGQLGDRAARAAHAVAEERVAAAVARAEARVAVAAGVREAVAARALAGWVVIVATAAVAAMAGLRVLEVTVGDVAVLARSEVRETREDGTVVAARVEVEIVVGPKAAVEWAGAQVVRVAEAASEATSGVEAEVRREVWWVVGQVGARAAAAWWVVAVRWAEGCWVEALSVEGVVRAAEMAAEVRTPQVALEAREVAVELVAAEARAATVEKGALVAAARTADPVALAVVESVRGAYWEALVGVAAGEREAPADTVALLAVKMAG